MRRSRELLILVAILMIGSLVRGVYLSEIVHNPDFDRPGVDAGYHDYWARGLATGDWSPPTFFGDPRIYSTPYFRPPGYPYFLALVYLIFGPNYLAARVVQMSLGVINCLLAFLLGRRWFGGRVGLILAGLMSVYWTFIYFEGELREPVLLIGLGLSLIYVLSLWTEKVTLWRSLGAGVLLGLSALVRPNVLPFAIVALGWLLWILHRRKDYRPLRVAALGFIVGTVLTVAPATIRNYVVAHDFVVISSNGGINLAIGNNEFADGLCVGFVSGLGDFRTAYDYPGVVKNLEKTVGRPLKHSEASKCFADAAIRYMKSHPLRVLYLTGRKTLLFWGPKEVSNEKEDECERSHSRVLRSIPITFPVALSLSIVGIAVLFLDLRRRRGEKGASLALVRSQYEVSVLILLFVAVYFATYLPFFVAGRYRVPVIPFLLLFGSYGLDQIGRLVARRDFKRAACWLLAWVVLYGLAAMNFTGYGPELAKWHYDRAFAYSGKGQIDQAVSEYSKALEARPDYADVHNNLGNALAVQGKLDEAAHHFSEALRIKPDYPDVHSNLGRVLVMQGKVDEAIREYREAIRLSPDFAEAHNNLAVALYFKGDYAGAWKEVHLSRGCGFSPHSDFLRTLSQRMPEPGE